MKLLATRDPERGAWYCGEVAQPVPHPPPDPGAASPEPRRPERDDIVRLDGVSWGDYQRIMEIRGEKSVPRLTYLEGVLELMSPSRSHESIKSMVGCLVEAWCLENDVDITPYGSWTHESKEAERGVEPDECYVLGSDADPQRCDLAIEVIWTSGSIKKLDVYKKLAVREVWLWQKGRLEPHELVGGEYRAISRSALLPGIDLELLLRFVDIRPMTRAIREYRTALRAGG